MKKAYLYVGIAAYTKVVGSIIITTILREKKDEPSELTKHYLNEYGLEDCTKYIEELVDIEYNQFIIPSFVLSSNKVDDIVPKKVQLLIYTTLNHYGYNINDVEIFISDYVFIPGLKATMPAYTSIWCDVAICLGLKIYQIELEELKVNLPDFNLHISNGNKTLMQCLYILLSKKPFALRAMNEIDYQLMIQFIAVTRFWFVVSKLVKPRYTKNDNFYVASSLREQSPFPIDSAQPIQLEGISEAKLKGIYGSKYCSTIFQLQDQRGKNKRHYLTNANLDLLGHCILYLYRMKKKTIIHDKNIRYIRTNKNVEKQVVLQTCHYISMYSFFTTLFLEILRKTNPNIELVYPELLFPPIIKENIYSKNETIFQLVKEHMEKGELECLPSLIDYTYLEKYFLT